MGNAASQHASAAGAPKSATPAAVADVRAASAEQQPPAIVASSTAVPPQPAAAATVSSWSSYLWRASPPAVPAVVTPPTLAAAPVVVSLHALAPPPAAAMASPSPLRAFAPVLGGCALLMAGSVAYGVRYGNKQAIKLEENYSQYEVKPQPQAEIEITPEMKRYAVRRALHAFGIGTALTMSLAAATSYGISRYWEVRTVPELNTKLTSVVGGIRMPFEKAATRLVDRFDLWVADSWFGTAWTTGPAQPVTPIDAPGVAAVAAQEAEMKDLWSEAKRNWNDMDQPKPDAKATTATLAANSSEQAKQ